ncbi:adenylate/guanylate cyclase domain-containing protein [Chitinispirillales bacterium ANBcel5]|uniref:adenylate/guanylate cyclase domain-containing protein n=1 Tax=Cellulosispirillum alkaliphilum TaxID=3039283 RepID=UPI002A4E5203|nr:adenylate/guanylate cyclase domain-containing protein [Chitinispirillales bacterium ANBcel5]
MRPIIFDKEIPQRAEHLEKLDYVAIVSAFSIFTLITYTGIKLLGPQILLFAYFLSSYFSWKYGIKRGFALAIVINVIIGLLVETNSHIDLNFYPAGLIGIFTILLASLLTGIVSNMFVKLKNTEELYRNEHSKSELLLKNILPEKIASRLKNGEVLIADRYKESTILFCDIVGFSTMAKNMEPHALVEILDIIVSSFDYLTEELKLEKIKTIGDAYLVVSGLPEKRNDHAHCVATMALRMLHSVESINKSQKLELKLRIGIHSGPVVGGVIGQSKFTFDLWGDTVNLASRLETYGVPGKIQVSKETYELIKDKFNLKYRGKTDLRSFGMVDTFFLESCKQEHKVLNF